jgi:hypothetical protein
MNKLIKHFAERAVEDAKLPASFWWVTQDPKMAKVAERFAELIVQQCAVSLSSDLVNLTGSGGRTMWNDGIRHSRNKMLNDFGLEHSAQDRVEYMNDTTRKLWNEATHSPDISEGVSTQEIANKFAELIVRECAKVMNNNDFEGSTIGKVILDHFGIEE